MGEVRFGGRWATAILLWSVACFPAGPAPELQRRRAALEAWRQAERALLDDDPASARRFLDKALSHSPDDPTLLLWRARTEAADGALQAAIDTVRTVVERHPDLPIARYNLAAYLARAGRPAEAAPHLQRALAGGAAAPREVLDDPDFSPHLRHPAMSFLPPAPVEATLEGPGGPVFVGSTAEITLTVMGLDLEELSVHAPVVRGPVRLEQAIARRMHLEDGDDRVEVAWSLRALGAGQTAAGPLHVAVGTRQTTARALTIETVAPPGAPSVQDESASLVLPSARAALGPSGQGAAVWREGATLLARVPPSARVEVAGATGPPIAWKRYDGRTLAWTLWTWADTPLSTAVVLREGGRVIHDGPVPLSPETGPSEP